MKQTLSKFIDPVMAVLITAPDFNGKGFDGSPFKYFTDKPPAWFMLALEKQLIQVKANQTDYAWFGITDEYGNTTWAGPGDFIINTGNFDEKNLVLQINMVVIPQAFMKIILTKFEQLDKNEKINTGDQMDFYMNDKKLFTISGPYHIADKYGNTIIHNYEFPPITKELADNQIKTD